MIVKIRDFHWNTSSYYRLINSFFPRGAILHTNTLNSGTLTTLFSRQAFQLSAKMYKYDKWHLNRHSLNYWSMVGALMIIWFSGNFSGSLKKRWLCMGHFQLFIAVINASCIFCNHPWVLLNVYYFDVEAKCPGNKFMNFISTNWSCASAQWLSPAKAHGI